MRGASPSLPSTPTCCARRAPPGRSHGWRLWTRCAWIGTRPLQAIWVNHRGLAGPHHVPLWMAYGGLFKLTPGSAAAPRPRFASALAALAFPYVRVPLMVMFPLGPQIVALYLWIGAPTSETSDSHNKRRARAPDKPHVPLRIVRDQVAWRAGEELRRNGGGRQIGTRSAAGRAS